MAETNKLTGALNLACLVAGIAIVWWYNSSSEKTASAEAARPIVSMKWDDVRAKYDENGVSAASYFKDYKVRFSGVVLTVNQALGFAGTVMLQDGSKEALLLAIEMADRAKLEKLTKGQTVDVVCGDMGLGIMPSDCQIN